MKRFWLQFSSLLAFQLQLNESEVMLNKTKTTEALDRKKKNSIKELQVWLECQSTSTWWAKLQAASQYLIFQDAPCRCRKRGGGGQSGGYHGEGAHGVKFVCLMMWTYVGCELTRKTSVISVQTQMIQVRVRACGGKNKLVCACMP